MISPTMHGNCSIQAEKRCGTKIWYYPVKVHQDVPWRTRVWWWRNYVALQWWGPSISKKQMLQTESIRMLVKWYMRSHLKEKKIGHILSYTENNRRKNLWWRVLTRFRQGGHTPMLDWSTSLCTYIQISVGLFWWRNPSTCFQINQRIILILRSCL